MSTAFSYIRFSSVKQADGDSLARQTKAAQDYADAHGLTLDKRTFQDLGVSAYKGRNAEGGALGDFIRAVDDGAIPRGTTLLVENFDRLSRLPTDRAMALFLSIIHRGITLVMLDGNQVYSEEGFQKDGGLSLIVSLTKMMRSHEETATKGDRVRKGLRASRAAFKPKNVCPMWLKSKPDRSGWDTNEERVALVRRIFDMSLHGQGGSYIARTLNTEGVFMPSRKQDTRKNDYWSSQQVLALLRTKSVIGMLTSRVGLDSLTDYYPQIIEPAVFYEVQRQIDARRHKVGRTGENVANLFTGLLKCKCGSAFRFGRPKGGYGYLTCMRKHAQAGCDERATQYEAFEQDILGRLLFDPNEAVVPLLTVEKLDPSGPIKAEIEETRAQHGRLFDLLTSGVLTNTVEVGLRINALDAKLKVLQASLEEAVAPQADPRDAVERAVSLYIAHEEAALEDDLTRYTEIRAELQTALRKIIRQVVLTGDTVFEGEQHVEYAIHFTWDDLPFRFSYPRPARRAYNKRIT